MAHCTPPVWRWPHSETLSLKPPVMSVNLDQVEHFVEMIKLGTDSKSSAPCCYSSMYNILCFCRLVPITQSIYPLISHAFSALSIWTKFLSPLFFFCPSLFEQKRNYDPLYFIFIWAVLSNIILHFVTLLFYLYLCFLIEDDFYLLWRRDFSPKKSSWHFKSRKW